MAKPPTVAKPPRVAKPTPPDSEPTTAVVEIPSPPRKTKRQKFTVETVHRGRLINAEYNPRTMDDYTRARLEKALKRHGLVAPITWNRRTGRIVGGHARIAAIDALEGSDDYFIDVAAVNLSEKEERELNIALNIAGVQGEFDIAKLGEMFAASGDLKIDYENAGLDRIEIEHTFAGTEFAKMFAATDATAGALDALANIGGTIVPTGDEPSATPATDAIDAAAREAIAKQHRAEMKAHHKSNVNSDPAAYVVIVLRDRDECARVAQYFDQVPGAQYLPGDAVLGKLGLTSSR